MTLCPTQASLAPQQGTVCLPPGKDMSPCSRDLQLNLSVLQVETPPFQPCPQLPAASYCSEPGLWAPRGPAGLSWGGGADAGLGTLPGNPQASPA
jgi:hypothetical protein